MARRAPVGFHALAVGWHETLPLKFLTGKQLFMQVDLIRPERLDRHAFLRVGRAVGIAA